MEYFVNLVGLKNGRFSCRIAISLCFEFRSHMA